MTNCNVFLGTAQPQNISSVPGHRRQSQQYQRRVSQQRHRAQLHVDPQSIPAVLNCNICLALKCQNLPALTNCRMFLQCPAAGFHMQGVSAVSKRRISLKCPQSVPTVPQTLPCPPTEYSQLLRPEFPCSSPTPEYRRLQSPTAEYSGSAHQCHLSPCSVQLLGMPGVPNPRS